MKETTLFCFSCFSFPFCKNFPTGFLNNLAEATPALSRTWRQIHFTPHGARTHAAPLDMERCKLSHRVFIRIKNSFSQGSPETCSYFSQNFFNSFTELFVLRQSEDESDLVRSSKVSLILEEVPHSESEPLGLVKSVEGDMRVRSFAPHSSGAPQS